MELFNDYTSSRLEFLYTEHQNMHIFINPHLKSRHCYYFPLLLITPHLPMKPLQTQTLKITFM